MPHVVVLGGSFAGITTSHKLLKHTLATVPELKITLVSPSHYLYWNFAAVRGVVPGELSDDQLFTDFLAGFSVYPSGSFEYISGLATQVDPCSNSVVVQKDDDENVGLVYDHLVLATGTWETSGLPFKTLRSGYEATVSALHDIQNKIESAQHIVIAGGGTTGSETVAEIATKYGKTKKVSLVLKDEYILPGFSESVRKAGTNTLSGQGVELIKNAKVESVNGHEIKLNNGETIQADCYIPTFGSKPNTQYLPAEFLDSNKFLKTKLTLQSEQKDNIWGVGDITNLEAKQATRIDPQVAHLWANLNLALQGKSAFEDYKVDLTPLVFVSLGKNAGIGQIGSFRVWSWVVAKLKSKTLFVDNAKQMVSGAKGMRATL